MGPIERAARALCKLDGHDPDGASFSSMGDPYWMFYTEKAKTVIAAIREPSAGMVAAAISADMPGGRMGEPTFRESHIGEADAPVVWTAMIDKMLEEGQ